MRATDTDRQSVADHLRKALDEGRLGLYEYDDRLRRAYEAATYGDLEQLLVDLPGYAVARSPAHPADAAPVAGTAGVRYPRATLRWLAARYDGYLYVGTLPTAIWLATSLSRDDWQFFWPMWVLVPLLAVMLPGIVTGVVRGEPQRWAAKQEAKRIARQRKRERQQLTQSSDTD